MYAHALLENHVLTVLADIRRKKLSGYGGSFAGLQGTARQARYVRKLTEDVESWRRRLEAFLRTTWNGFFAGSSTYFNDIGVRKEILATAEMAGHTIRIGNKRHYLLTNIALVGESIMLAMRTHFKHR